MTKPISAVKTGRGIIWGQRRAGAKAWVEDGAGALDGTRREGVARRPDGQGGMGVHGWGSARWEDWDRGGWNRRRQEGGGQRRKNGCLEWRF